jgi:hypothetical protein
LKSAADKEFLCHISGWNNKLIKVTVSDKQTYHFTAKSSSDKNVLRRKQTHRSGDLTLRADKRGSTTPVVSYNTARYDQHLSGKTTAVLQSLLTPVCFCFHSPWPFK